MYARHRRGTDSLESILVRPVLFIHRSRCSFRGHEYDEPGSRFRDVGIPMFKHFGKRKPTFDNNNPPFFGQIKRSPEGCEDGRRGRRSPRFRSETPGTAAIADECVSAADSAVDVAAHRSGLQCSGVPRHDPCRPGNWEPFIHDIILIGNALVHTIVFKIFYIVLR